MIRTFEKSSLRGIVEALEPRRLLSAVSRPVDLPFRLGVNAPSWWHDEFLSAESDQRIAALASNTDSNTFEIVPTWYMPDKWSNTIAPSATKSVTDAALVHAIQLARSHGLSVILKPHVDVANDAAWRGEITPSNTSSWFASYKNFINHYAQIAKDQGCDMFVVGTELKSMNGSAYTAQWNSVIDGIEAIYSGPLTYAANWDDFKSVKFWNRLDVIGIDQYTPLGSQGGFESVPSVAELVNRWQPIVNDISNWRTQNGFSQHVLLTEIGYETKSDSHRTFFSTSGAYDPAAQQRCYEAATQVWSSQDWMDGLLWWAWTKDPNDTGWSPLNKPAQNVMKFGSVGGTVFNDANGNGVKDAAEVGIAGWTIYLDANNNNQLDASEYSTTTDANGAYTIDRLLVGNYQVRSVIQNGYRKTNPIGTPGYAVSLAAAQNVANQNFAVTSTVVLTGTVYHDANQDQSRGASEIGIGGARVYIDFNNNGTYEAGEPFKTADDNGNFRFGAMLAGTGTIRVEMPPGWIAVMPATGSYSGTVTSGQIVPNVNFGLYALAPTPAPVATGGTVEILHAAAARTGVIDDEIALLL